ncbi:MAG TPA: response regulator [Phycisphaerales bacterium]|nr:response regulator [Phycisphaerales bacterium]
MAAARTKILVVDDLPEKVIVYRSVLEDDGIEVVAASSGAEALRRLMTEEFAVILLDINMPGMDGFETASLIRSRKKCAHTPIIFVTAHADELHALRGYSYGAVDYILAPIDPEILRTKVRVFVELYRQAASRIAAVEREWALLSDLLDRTSDFVVRVDGSMKVLRLSAAGRRMLGYGEEERPPVHLNAFFEPVAFEAMRAHVLPAARSTGVWLGDSILRTRTGRDIPVSQVILVHTSPEGGGESYSIVARDISAKREVEAELDRHRAHLEELVRERTSALEQTHERLRLADRLASIGTLAAGLGHDMGNLLMPIRMRLDMLEQMPLPEEAQADLRAIADACEYLKRLSRGLRNFALNPEDRRASGEKTNLSKWWPEMAPFLQNVLPRGINVESDIPEDLPNLAIPPHVLTQAVYNIVQNAGDAMKSRETGRVRVSASRGENGSDVIVEVADDGPGMTPDVLRRCMEPLYTTKTRTLSTGLGLALIRGAIHNVGGSIDIQSEPGRGTAVRLAIPVAIDGEAAAAAGRDDNRRVCVSLKSVRNRAIVRTMLKSRGFEVDDRPWSAVTECSLIVTDEVPERGEELDEFVRRGPNRRAVVLGNSDSQAVGENITFIASNTPAAELRTLLDAAISCAMPETAAGAAR